MNSNAVYLFTNAVSSDFGSDDCASTQRCYGELDPVNGSTTQFVTLSSSTSYISLDYDVCYGTDNASAISYDANGNPSCKTYMGHFGVVLTNTSPYISFSKDDVIGGVASIGNPVINAYPITFNSNTVITTYNYPKTPTNSYTGAIYRGINLSGADYDYAFSLPSLYDGAFYAQNGMNTIRLPFKWEYLQSTTSQANNTPGGTIDFTQNPNAIAYESLVRQYLAQGMIVIIDMHNYMRFGGNDYDSTTNNTIIGSGVNGAPTANEYADAWVSIGNEFKNESNVMFDLMNEPNTMSTQLILDNYNTVIQALRTNGINNKVLLEGNAYSGAWSWADSSYDNYNNIQPSNADVFTQNAIKDSQNNYLINVHQYFDYNYSGLNDCVANSVPSESGLINYLNSNNLQAIVTEFGGLTNSYNCQSDINQFLNNINLVNSKNASGVRIIGWTAWDGGANATGVSTYVGPVLGGSPTVTWGALVPLLTPPQQ